MQVIGACDEGVLDIAAAKNCAGRSVHGIFARDGFAFDDDVKRAARSRRINARYGSAGRSAQGGGGEFPQAKNLALDLLGVEGWIGPAVGQFPLCDRQPGGARDGDWRAEHKREPQVDLPPPGDMKAKKGCHVLYYNISNKRVSGG